MKVLLKLICLLGLLYAGSVAANENDNEKVNVTIYYETHCPGSLMLIEKAIATWKTLKNLFEITFVPYGLAYRDLFTDEIFCHHGERECFANKVHACVLKCNYMSSAKKMDVIHCLSKEKLTTNSLINSCARKFNFPPDVLARCANGQRGTTLLIKYAEMTEKLDPQLEYVPSCIFNGVRNDTIDIEAFKDFRGTLCKITQCP